MEGFTTPKRSTKSENVCGGGAANSSKRVVRSALELLAEMASPELLRQNNVVPSNAVTSSKFTVTNTAAPPGPAKPLQSVSCCVTGQPLLQQRGHQWSSPERSCSVAAEEPSTLLFLSPSFNKASDADVVRRSLFMEKKRMPVGHSSSSSGEITGLKESCQPLKTANEELFCPHGNSDEWEEVGETVATFRSQDHMGGRIQTKEQQFSESEVQQRIVEALKSYERTRNAEEEAMLQEVGFEMKAQRERYEKLLKQTKAIAAERDALEKEVGQLSLRCGVGESEGCNVSAQELEVRPGASELCDLRSALEHMKSERAQMAIQLEECEKEQLMWRKRCAEVEHTNERLLESVGTREGMKCQKQGKSRDEKEDLVSPSESAHVNRIESESRIQSLEEALQKQCCEVRRRMHRIYMLEGEQAKSERITKSLRRVVREAGESFDLIRRELELCLQAFGVPHPDTKAKEESNLVAGSGRPAPCSLRNGVVPPETGDKLGLLFAKSGGDPGTGCICDDNTSEGLKRSDISRPKVRGEFFDSIPGDRLAAERLGADKAVVEAGNRFRDRSAHEEDENAMCKRLQHRQQRCERLVEALRRLFSQKQLEQRRQFRRLEAQLAESAEADASRYRDALVACQMEIEKMNQHKQRLDEELGKREVEIGRLNREVEELRSSRHNETVQCRGLLEDGQKLCRERDALQVQLDMIAKECAELHRCKETADADICDLQRQLAAALESQHQKEEESLQESRRQMAKLARCSMKLKEVQKECQDLRDQNSAMSDKMKVVQQQLQALRAHRQRDGSTQRTQQQQLKKLTALAEELREVQRFDAALHTKERAEAEASLQKVTGQNKGLLRDVDQLKHSLSEARSEIEQQKWAEKALLGTLLSIQLGVGADGVRDFDKEGGDTLGRGPTGSASAPELGSTCTTAAVGVDMDITELRRAVVSLCQRTVVELTRLRETVSAVPGGDDRKCSSLVGTTADCELDRFRVAEQLAWGAARRSVERRRTRRSSSEHNMLTKVKQRVHSFCTPSRYSSHYGFSSPELVSKTVNVTGLHLRSPPVFADDNYMGGSGRGKKRSPDASSSSPLSTNGASRSRSGNAVLDGSTSPAPPPALGGFQGQ